MKQTPLVSIVILNLDGLKDTTACLNSIFKNTKYKNIEVLVLDNGSKINEAEILADRFANIKTYRLNTNKGFTGGNNWIIKKAKGKYIVLLNNDTEVEKLWLSPLIKTLEDNNKIAVVQPKIRMLKKKKFFDYAGATGGFIDKYGYPFTRGRIFDTQEKDEGQYDNTTRIFWASGAACVIRKSVVNKVGGLFSENLFNYMEEIDFCWRVWNRGYQVHYVPNSIVYHKGASTSKKNILKKRFWEHRNNLFILTRNLDRNSLVRILLPRLVFELFTYLGYLLNGEYKNIVSLAFAHLDYAKKFVFIRYKRNRLPNKKTLPIYQGSIVLDYFSGKKKTFSSLDWSPQGNIAYILFNTKSSGGAKLIFDQANKFIEKGYGVKIYTIFGKKIDWFHLNAKVLSIYKSFLYFSPDILIATFWPTSYLVKLLKGVRRCYLTLDTPDFYSNKMVKRLVKLSYKINLKHIVISKYLYKSIKSANNSAKPLLIKAATINTNLYKLPKRKTKEIKTRVKIVSVISRYEYYKGPDLLTEAVKNLKSKHPNYDFTLVSREDKPYSMIFDHFYSNPSDKKLVSLYQTSHILLVCSRAEGLFLPGLEAMACGCLVVTTKSGGITEYVNKHNSIIVNKVSDIWNKDVIENVIRNPKYIQLVSNGLKTSKKYGEDDSMSNLENEFFGVQ